MFRPEPLFFLMPLLPEHAAGLSQARKLLCGGDQITTQAQKKTPIKKPRHDRYEIFLQLDDPV